MIGRRAKACAGSLLSILMAPLLLQQPALGQVEEPMFTGDPVASDGRPVPMVPDAPSVDPGNDGKFGTRDDVIGEKGNGDVDLRMFTYGRSAPPASRRVRGERFVPVATAEPFGEGVPVAFVGVPAGATSTGTGMGPVASPALDGNMLLAAAFADLDGDGFVGITNLDGNPADNGLEELELRPVGRRLAGIRRVGPFSLAWGDLHIAAGGPSGAELDVIVAGVAITGDIDLVKRPDSYLPDGTLVMTRLPFFPDLDHGYRRGGKPSSNGLFAMELEAGLEPDPADPRIGEQFTIAIDDLGPTLGPGLARSGAFVGFGLARPLVSSRLVGEHDRLRPGLGADGERVLLQMLDHLMLPDDDTACVETLQLVPVDRLGNVADLDHEVEVTLEARGGLHIVSPDLDGDPTRETLHVSGSAGVPVVFDDGDRDGELLLGTASSFSRVPVHLVDPDRTDPEAIRRAKGAKEGESDYHESLDLNRDRRIDRTDLWIAYEYLDGCS